MLQSSASLYQLQSSRQVGQGDRLKKDQVTDSKIGMGPGLPTSFDGVQTVHQVVVVVVVGAVDALWRKGDFLSTAFSFSLVICRAERIQSNVPVFLCALTYSSKVRSG